MEGERQRALVVIRRMDDRLHVVGGMIWQSPQIRQLDALRTTWRSKIKM
jgi:hypothetical protein